MATQAGLVQEVVTNLEGYLSGRLDGSVISNWATQVLSSRKTFESPLVEEALVAMANLDHGDQRLDTAAEDLEFYRDCLLGKRSYDPPVHLFKRED
jgi:hypothetical protein